MVVASKVVSFRRVESFKPRHRPFEVKWMLQVVKMLDSLGCFVSHFTWSYSAFVRR